MNNNYNNNSNNNNNLFIISGNCRTFLTCIDSCVNNLINKLDSKSNNEILFYIKLKDERTKEDKLGGEHDIYNTDNIEYAIYPNTTHEEVINKIKEINNSNKYKIYYKILHNDELTNEDLYKKIKDKKTVNTMTDGNSSERYINRALQQSYNYYACGKIIEDIQQKNKYNFNNIIYLRPDMYFTSETKPLHTFMKDSIILIKDHIAIVPSKYIDEYFFGPMNIIENNTIHEYKTIEEIFFKSIHNKFEEYEFIDYYLKRKE